MDEQEETFRIAKMAEVLGVSRSGYYRWRKRKPGLRAKKNKGLLERIQQIHEETRGTYGSRKIVAKLNERRDRKVNHKRVERLMRENGISSKVSRRYKATTDSKHDFMVA